MLNPPRQARPRPILRAAPTPNPAQANHHLVNLNTKAIVAATTRATTSVSTVCGPALLWQVEQRIAAHQGDATSAGADEFSLGQLAQIVARRAQRGLAVGDTDVSAEMYPGHTPFRNRAFPSRSAGQESSRPR